MDGLPPKQGGRPYTNPNPGPDSETEVTTSRRFNGNNHQIERIEHEATWRGVHLDTVIDFVHVLEYRWKAADDLHPSQHARQNFVARTARQILEGKIRPVITDLRYAAEAESSHGTKASGVERAAAYPTAKTEYLGYDIASPWAGQSPPASPKDAAAT